MGLYVNTKYTVERRKDQKQTRVTGGLRLNKKHCWKKPSHILFVFNDQFNLMFIVLIIYYQLSPFAHYIVV